MMHHSQGVSRVWILSLVTCVFVFCCLASWHDEPLLQTLDQRLSLKVYDYSTHPMVDQIYIMITHFGSIGFHGIVMLICIIYLYKKRNIKWIIISAIYFIASRLSNVVLKAVFSRERPHWEHLVEVYSTSFPSGHAMNSAAFFGFMGYLISTQLKPKYTVHIWFSVILLIILISISRVYVGVHYMMDVFAGVFGGAIWVLLGLFTIKKLNKSMTQQTTLSSKK